MVGRIYACVFKVANFGHLADQWSCVKDGLSDYAGAFISRHVEVHKMAKGNDAP